MGRRVGNARFVFSQGELMTEGGWAGVKVTPASEEAGTLPLPAGGYGGERPPQGGGKGTAGSADRHAERAVSSAGRATFPILAMRKPGTVLCAVSSTA